jgi:FixJ family two-component response regulator
MSTTYSMPLIQLSKLLEPSPMQPAIGAQVKRKSVEGNRGQGLVFVIDDDELFRNSIATLVRSAGLKVQAFASAEEFLLSRIPDIPACVILDVRLPGMSGLHLQQRMAESGIEIPIIFMTGYGDIRMSVSAMKAGAVEFLTKPFSDHDLIEAIQNGIERNRVARQRSSCQKPGLSDSAEIKGELNRLAGEIHDGVAQHLTAIHMQLAAAKCALPAAEADWRPRVDRAIEIAKQGLVEARRCAHSLHASILGESALSVELQRLADRWDIVGRWRCQFQFDRIPENKLSNQTKHGLLRIAQETIHNAARHANPTLILLTLRWRPPNLVFQIIDNGEGISADRLQVSEGFGLCNMRNRAEDIGARFELQTTADRGTTVTVTVPIP